MVEQKVSSGWEYLAARREPMEYPNNLRRLRDARKLTQADVAEALGINQAEYSRMEKGRRRVGTHLETQTPNTCLLYTSPSPRDGLLSRMPSSA